jgi:N-acetylglutamate synthase-like GNAT family acetyltransferase
MGIVSGYTITTDLARFDFAAVVALLHDTYWAANRTREQIEASFRSTASIPFSLLDSQGRTIGVARVVTDRLTIAWLCDVVIHPEQRGGGLGKFLVDHIMKHPDLDKPGVRMVLGTRDAHGLYEQFGFFRRELMWRHPGGGNEPAGF